MEWHFTPYAGILVIIGFIMTIIAYLVWRRRAIPGGLSFVLMMAAIAELSFVSALEIAATGIPAKVFWAKIEYLGNQSAPVLFLIFALEYTHQDERLTRRNVLLLCLVPIASIIIAGTNDWHKLMWTSFTLNPDDSTILIYGHGIWFWVCAAYGYSLGVIGWIALFRAAIHAPLFRRQMGILLAAAIMPGVGGAIYLTGLSPVAGLDTAPITLALTGLILAVGIFLFGLFDLVPVARNVLVENMSDGVLVLNEQDRIVDINQAARKLLGASAQSALGRPLDSALAAWPELLEKCRGTREAQTEVCLSKEPAHYLDLNISQIFDWRRHFAGKIIVLHDSTRRKQMQESLVHNAEELGIINRINQAITSGLDLDRVLKTLHEQCSLVAPIDIFYVSLYDERTALIQIPLFYENGQYRIGPARDLRNRPGNIGEVIQKRKTLYLENIERSVTTPRSSAPVFGETSGRSYIGIPLILRDLVIGAVSIQSYKPNAYTGGQIGMLETIAVQAAIAIGNALLYAEVQRLAIIDELTGLYNYRGLTALGTREIERARRFTHPLSVLFFDIDDFKEFNNHYSHSTGNRVLKAVAACCQNILRSVDLISRYGGDEFVILLPETDLDTARGIAERLNQKIAALQVPTEFGDLKVAVSIGLTGLSDDIKDIFALVDRANQGEHQAKQAGGNRTVVIKGQ